MKKLFPLFMMMALTISVFAQVPLKMSYQAVIRNSNGQLVADHDIGMRISILQGSASGTSVYVETQTPNTNVNGLATIEIGGGTPVTGTFAGIDWSIGTYFIKIETDPTGGTSYTITGTSQILSVPYALHSKTTAGYSETDPVFIAHPSIGITGANIINWNTAYSWGNHTGLYRPISYVSAWSEITGKPTSIEGYGIIDAVTISGNQTITGTKTFSFDLLVNGLTIGKGKNALSGNIAIGSQALSSNTTGNYNTAIGVNTLQKNTSGNYNTAIGFDALIFNTEGNNNTANGNLSLYANTTGSGNTAGGSNSLSSNTAGNYNTATGSYALYRNTEGTDNTANGYGALNSNTTGNYNTASGKMALYANTSGMWNTAYGSLALQNNTTGTYNTATGGKALNANTTGNNNTASGNGALSSNTTGSDNAAYGHYSLYNNTAGNFNTAYGNNSLYSNTTGYSNTAVGYRALYLNTTGQRNTAVGDSALHNNTTGSSNTANGYSALNFTTTGARNTGIGVNAGNVNITGNEITCIGYFANVGSDNLTNATALGYNSIVNASNKIVLGNASATTVGGYGAWTNYSDRRLKENITYKNNLGLDFITRLKPVTFIYINDTNKRMREGLIAQDVEFILNELDIEFSGLIIDDDPDKTMNLSYPAFVIPLITAVQEQQKQIEDQQKEIDELKSTVSRLISERE